MSRETKVALVSGDDWTALYVEGRLVDQGHSIGLARTLENLGFDLTYLTFDEDWINDRGDAPQLLSEVKTQSDIL